MSSLDSSESDFCDGPLWDANLTWFTDNPDFTTCFHQTVLLYVPFVILILLTPLEFYFAKQARAKDVPWSLLSIGRCLLTIGLIILPIVDLGYIIDENTSGDGVKSVHTVAALVKIFSYIWALVLHLFCMKRGMVTSGVLTCFWGLAAIFGILTFRSVLMTPYVVGDEAILPFTSYTVQFPLVVAIFFLTCWADPKPRISELDDDVSNLTPEKHASFVSKTVFAWFDVLAWKGWRNTLNETDLWELAHDNKSAGIVPKWEKYWDKALAEAKTEKKKVSIVSTLWKVFGPQYAFAALLQLLYSVLQFASPQIVNLLITFVQSDDPQWKGYFYTVLICVVTFVTTILNSQTFYVEYIVGLKVKTALISSIYKKATRLSNSGRKEMTVGETTNLMSIDTQKFMDLMLYLNMGWSSPLQIALAMFFLWQVLGPSAMAGLAVMICMIPLNAVVAQKMKKYQVSQMKDKDRRSKLMDEILNGIKVLKLYAWEPSFQKKVLDIRNNEVGALIKAAYLNSVTTFLWTSAPFLVALASFTTFVLSDSDNILDANTAFVSLTLFNLLRIPLNILPMLIVFLVQCQVSVQRINKFMNAGELNLNEVSHDESAKDPLIVENATFNWDDDKKAPPVLKNINIRVPAGALVAVVGNVGAGKSSLISALLGELKVTSGKVNTVGKLAYVPQQAWMQNSSLQDNITFGKKFNEDLYNRVLEACALVPDLKMLPGGDQTEIGEKGINLSGGQKQRISMARSVYSNGNLYLLDDPLSAVDSHVGKHIFEQVIGPAGLLKNKTRILVTNAISYLPETDNIFVMKDGRISEQGTYHQLLAQGGEFAEFLVQYITEKGDKDLDPQTESELEELKLELESALGKDNLERRLSIARSIRTTLSDYHSDIESIGRAIGLRRRKRVGKSQTTTSSSSMDGQHKVRDVAVGQVLIEDEKMEVGGVKWSIYRYYGRSLGIGWTLACLFFFLSYQAFQLGGNIWLSAWSTDPEASTVTSVRNLYLIVYGVLGFCQSFSVMVATAIAMVATLNAATKLHSTMLSRILRSPMSFFDTTPLGRVLNRFSKDMDILDITMPMNFRLLLVQLYNVIGTMFIICYSNPLFVTVVVPIGIMYYLLQKFYVTTARQVKRLESITRSPIYSHFGETISGAPTIRAYGAVNRFIFENERKIDMNQKCYYPTYTSSRWLSVRLESIGNLVILFASLFAVIAKDKMDPGNVGLSLSYALNVTGAMNLLVRMTSEVETNMVSVERIREYQETPQEAPYEVPDQDPPPSWPEYGVVKFDNYQTRYREGLDLVLKGLSFQIMSGEKIGIVGRTGAGKSSLTLALFRIVEAAGGSINIDGENIGLMGLGRLRSRLTIIPQDPVLFSGSMRMNLDPFGQYSDRDIWKSLELAHLRSFVSNLPGGLNFEVNEGGENLSVGQRQLVCLARALLRKTKVLILDEATAAVDMETDDLIQQTIRSEFGECTVLTIAHRLNTIMDSSRVMVLDAGLVREFDTPETLLRNKKTIFYGMAKDAGLTNDYE